MLILNRFYNEFKIYILFIFVYSGLLKWIPFPIDLTLLFGFFCLIILIRDFLLSKIILFNIDKFVPILLFVAFCIWYLLTGIYTSSEHFWIDKSKSIFLLIISFLYPIYCLKNIEFIEIAKKFLIFVSFFLIVLLYLQLNGFLGIINAESDEFRSEFHIPDYLTISELLICGFFVSLLFKNKLFIIYRIIIIFISIQLGARAPIIFLVLSYILYLLIEEKWDILKFKNIFLFIITSLIIYQIFSYWEGAELLKNRFFSLQSIQSDDSSATRLIWMKESLNLIASNPFFGIGIGGAGIELIGYDENAYPHNHFIETYLESGLLGFILILGFWFSIFKLLNFLTTNKRHLIISLIILFLFFNYMKSGSFSDIRKMFVWIGLLLTFYDHFVESGPIQEKVFSNKIIS